jgi:hypothetical protein
MVMEMPAAIRTIFNIPLPLRRIDHAKIEPEFDACDGGNRNAVKRRKAAAPSVVTAVQLLHNRLCRSR